VSILDLRDAGDPVELAKIYSMKELMNWFSRHWQPKNEENLLIWFLKLQLLIFHLQLERNSVKDVDVLLQNGAESIHQFIGS
jgi:hypothetical protein